MMTLRERRVFGAVCRAAHLALYGCHADSARRLEIHSTAGSAAGGSDGDETGRVVDLMMSPDVSHARFLLLTARCDVAQVLHVLATHSRLQLRGIIIRQAPPLQEIGQPRLHYNALATALLAVAQRCTELWYMSVASEFGATFPACPPDQGLDEWQRMMGWYVARNRRWQVEAVKRLERGLADLNRGPIALDVGVCTSLHQSTTNSAAGGGASAITSSIRLPHTVDTTAPPSDAVPACGHPWRCWQSHCCVVDMCGVQGCPRAACTCLRCRTCGERQLPRLNCDAHLSRHQILPGIYSFFCQGHSPRNADSFRHSWPLSPTSTPRSRDTQSTSSQSRSSRSPRHPHGSRPS